jgi:predicted RNase H-like HicB family nuclease
LCYNGVDEEREMEYTVIIRKAPDGFYIASCPLVPEARAQGKTYGDCMTNIKEVLELCLEYRKERGEEIPKEIEAKKVTIAI